MTKPKRRKPSNRPRLVNLGAGRRHLLIAAVVVAVGIVAVVAMLQGSELGSPGSPLPSLAAPGVYQAPTDASPTSAFQALHGRWLRPDGGYILDIRRVGDSGTIEAVYLNPRPIPVVRAKAIRDSSTLNVFVELRAPGYPGSTYTLTYDPKGDRLAGIYFQAALQQHFDVVFVRMR
jgi:hypothetical protein